ncbi:efflux RND transporter periplasmic adaptor subunit [Ciceribacter sp. L1K22]|uniref:efflux RND transporter periplasmic adaptor subunit n=1 Tax=Ciceribacter sp. L1K22 TaxID=2820275 RepID=UPI001ABE3FD5|nr:efflux RND transporter periplasmic adaptor subunit [Ciceribacter sp. L1K22]MBO3760839.1 efflux RND transporter periplasmic adaptor subunit [Ciceribacter sp. L1K22]
MQRLRTILLVACSCASLAACAPAEEAGDKAPRHVETVTVRATPWSEKVSSTGEINARVQSELSFRISGRIIERLADVGDRVAAGEVLARIDSEEQQADLQVALATLQSAEAQQTQAQQAFDRQQSLFTTGVSTRAALDEAREALLRADATVDSAKAQVDTARDTLAQTELKADANGIITARNAEVGQVAQAAQLIFTLAQDGPRDAVFNADESLFLGLGLGRTIEDEVEVRPLSGGAPMKAMVREISPTIDTSTGTIRVKLAIEGDPQVSLGSPVVATARYTPVDTIELPWSAIASDAGRPAVWIVDPQTSKVSLRPVEILVYGSESFSVRSGLKPGEIVVTAGTKFISDGDVVAYEGAAQ